MLWRQIYNVPMSFLQTHVLSKGPGLGLAGILLMLTTFLWAGDERVSTDTSIYHQGPSVVRLGNGDTVFVWESGPSSSFGDDISARRYDSLGQPLDASEVLVNTYTSGRQRAPTVDGDGSGGFVVIWQSGENDASTQSLRGQIYGSDGSAQGSEFQVNTQTNGFQVRPSVAVNDDGSFVVVWEATSFDGDDSGIAARLFDSLGNALGAEFLVNEITTGDQRGPEVAADGLGGFVVVWGFNEIDGRLFDSLGNPLGPDFQAAPPHTLSGTRNGLSRADDGSFLVVYTDNAGLNTVQGMLYDSTGSLITGPMEISTDQEFTKSEPAVDVDSAGNFQVTWSSNGQDGSGRGIYTQQVAPDGMLLGPETRVNSQVGSNQSRPDVSIDADDVPTFTWQSPFDSRAAIYTNCASLGPCPVFADGFESGTTTGWSASSP